MVLAPPIIEISIEALSGSIPSPLAFDTKNTYGMLKPMLVNKLLNTNNTKITSLAREKSSISLISSEQVKIPQTLWLSVSLSVRLLLWLQVEWRRSIKALSSAFLKLCLKNLRVLSVTNLMYQKTTRCKYKPEVNVSMLIFSYENNYTV